MKRDLLFAKLFVFALLATAAVILTGCAGPYEPEDALACAFAGNCDEIPSALQRVSVKVEGSGNGMGDVLSRDAAVGIACVITGDPVTFDATATPPDKCDVTFQDAGLGGTFVLEAIPRPDMVFVGWSDDCTGSAPTCTLSFNAGPDVEFTVTAHFYVAGSF